MKIPLLILALIALLSLTALAQKPAGDYNKVEIFAGYSGVSSINSDDSLSGVESGFNAAAAYNIHRYIGIKFDVSGTFANVDGTYFAPVGGPPIPLTPYHANHSLYNIAAGVQFKNNTRDAVVKPFGHVLVGVAKHNDRFTTACPAGAVCPPFDSDFTGFSLIVGGGLDFKITRRIDIRAIQLDLDAFTTHIGQQNGSSENLRFSSGIIFKF